MIVGLFSACQEDYEPEFVEGHELSGEWYVVFYDSAGTTAYTAHDLISTYNTATGGASEAWLDDLGHFWPMKGKIPINTGNMSLAGTADNMSVPIMDTLGNITGYETMTVIAGNIIEDAGRSKTGVVTDSLFLRMSFSDDPGSQYVIAGHRRTGFLEDDY